MNRIYQLSIVLTLTNMLHGLPSTILNGRSLWFEPKSLAQSNGKRASWVPQGRFGKRSLSHESLQDALPPSLRLQSNNNDEDFLTDDMDDLLEPESESFVTKEEAKENVEQVQAVARALREQVREYRDYMMRRQNEDAASESDVAEVIVSPSEVKRASWVPQGRFGKKWQPQGRFGKRAASNMELFTGTKDKMTDRGRRICVRLRNGLSNVYVKCQRS